MDGESRVREVASGLESIFQGLMRVERLLVNKEDVFDACRVVLEKLHDEVKLGNEVLINVSGSLRQMAIACYIAALVSGTPIYSVIPEYGDDFQEIGVKEIHSIPHFPITEISANSLRILEILNEKGAVRSIDQLMVLLDSESEKEEYHRFRGRINYYLKELDAVKFIDRERRGKSVRLRLTDSGRIFIFGHRIRALKAEKKG